MTSDSQKLFRSLEAIEPPAGLAEKIIRSINKRKIRNSRITLFFSLTAMLVSIACLYPASRLLISEFSHSGFGQYASMIFTDSGLALAYWKELSISIAESAPLSGIIAVLLSLLAALWAIRLIAKNVRPAYYQFNR